MTSLCVDEDLPLSYQFGYYLFDVKKMIVLRPQSPLSYTSTLLPSGISESNWTLSSVVNVLDSLSSVCDFDV